MFLCMFCNVEYMKYTRNHTQKENHIDNDRFNIDEHCNFLMEIDDDEIHEIEEFVKYNGNSISINVYGIHKDIKKQCADSLVGEYMNNIDESRQLNNIDKHDRLLRTEDDYDTSIFPMYITKNTKPNTIHIDLLHIVDEDNNGHFVYIKDFEKLSGKHNG